MTWDLKDAGYLVSTGSVLPLGAVSWSSASQHPLLMACLLIGAAMSMIGMALRCLSHRRDRLERESRDRSDRSPASRSEV